MHEAVDVHAHAHAPGHNRFLCTFRAQIFVAVKSKFDSLFP